jgi:hypothetical protein
MTQLGKSIITIGIGIFTATTLLWIITADWHWFAGGGAVFLGAALTATIISVETKDTTPKHSQWRATSPSPPENRTADDLQPTKEMDKWEPPSTPPPDEEDGDAFFRPQRP